MSPNIHPWVTKMYVAGHGGLVGGAVVRALLHKGHDKDPVVRSRSELDLTDQLAVREFFERERPDAVILAAAKVGGIHANNSHEPAQFIRDNLLIQGQCHRLGVQICCQEVRIPGIELYLPEIGSATDQGGLPAHRTVGAHQRVVCDRQDRGCEVMPGVPATVWFQGHLADAHQPVRSRRQLPIG